MRAPLLDTHIWIWWMNRDPGLSIGELNELDHISAVEPMLLSDISLWEIAMMVERKRISLKINFQNWLTEACNTTILEIYPITPSIAAEVVRLPESFHRDPADRIIVSTARVLKRKLYTKDKKILSSRLVEVW